MGDGYFIKRFLTEKFLPGFQKISQSKFLLTIICIYLILIGNPPTFGKISLVVSNTCHKTLNILLNLPPSVDEASMIFNNVNNVRIRIFIFFIKSIMMHRSKLTLRKTDHFYIKEMKLGKTCSKVHKVFLFSYLLQKTLTKNSIIILRIV